MQFQHTFVNDIRLTFVMGAMLIPLHILHAHFAVHANKVGSLCTRTRLGCKATDQNLKLWACPLNSLYLHSVMSV